MRLTKTILGTQNLCRVCFLCGCLSVLPLIPAHAQQQNGEGAALPQLGDLPRSPGLEIPTGDLGGDPFGDDAEAKDQPVIPEPSPEQVESEIRKKAFDAAVTGLLPLKPAEVRDLLNQFDKVQQAVDTPVYPYPKPEIVAQTISFDPGSTPPEIKVAAGHVTTLNILDESGERFPILDITWAGDFDVEQPGKNGNTIRITPTSDFAYGNMVVSLPGLITPISFILKAHRDSVHYRFDATVPVKGPYTKPPLVEGAAGITLAAGGDAALSKVLDGVVPDDAKRLVLSGADSRTSAYRMGATTYVRTPLLLLSPGWSRSAKSADGMNVYALANAPVLLLSDQGQVVRVRLEEEKDGTK